PSISARLCASTSLRDTRLLRSAKSSASHSGTFGITIIERCRNSGSKCSQMIRNGSTVVLNKYQDREIGKCPKMESHDEFRELCAIATSGELSEQEQRKLREHLTGCPECRQALREFEAVVDIGVPLLASQLSAEHSGRSASTQPMVPKSNDIEE